MPQSLPYRLHMFSLQERDFVLCVGFSESIRDRTSPAAALVTVLSLVAGSAMMALLLGWHQHARLRWATRERAAAEAAVLRREQAKREALIRQLHCIAHDMKTPLTSLALAVASVSAAAAPPPPPPPGTAALAAGSGGAAGHGA